MKETAALQKLKVEIYGETYTLKGAQSENHLRQVAGLLNKRMYEVSSRNSRLSTTHVAILAALNLADELQKIQDDYQSLVKLLGEEKAK